VIAAILALLAYPVLGTLALWTGFVEWILRSEDLRVEIENPAYTIWPGRIHMKRVGIYVNGDTQFTLEGKDLVGKLRLLPMLLRRFHVTELEARDVRYRMRTQVDSTGGIEERLAAYPPLPELPGANLLREKDAEQTEERESPWTVQIEGIEVRVSELWFMEYRYLGDGTLTGGFLVAPNRMRVDTSVQDLGPGELRFGEKESFAKNFSGRISATIPELDPEQHADESFLDFVTARLDLTGDVQSLRPVGAYVSGVDVSHGKGRLRADVYLDRGWLGPKSKFNYETDDLRVTSKAVRVKTDWKLHADLSAEGTQRKRELPRIQSRARSTYLLLAGRSSRAVSVGIHGHEQDVSLKSRQIGSLAALQHARASFPTIVSDDLGDLDALLPERSPLRIDRGSARASVELEVDDRYRVRGPIRLGIEQAKLRAAGIDLGGKLEARARASVDLKSKRSALRNLSLKLSDVTMSVGDEQVSDWWFALSSARVSAWQLPPERFETTLAIRAKDAEPVLEALAEKDELNDLIAKFTSLDDLRATASLRRVGKVTDVTLASESDVWDVSGRIYSDGKRSLTAIVIGGQAVSLGFASDGKETELEPFAKTSWLNERLRRFPKPLKQFTRPTP
jgi:hypothetical protein